MVEGVFGNPWIFREIIYFLETGEKLPKPTLQEKLDVIIKHINMEVAEKGEDVAIKEMRKQISWYIKNLKDSSKMREKINSITKQKQIVQEITEYFNSL